MNHETIEKVETVFSLLVALGLQAACASDIDGAELSTAEMPRPCIASETILPPADGLIADFTDPDGGMDVGGVRIAYPLESPSAPTYTTTGGSLHITVATPATSVDQYLGVVVGFPNRSCVDASDFTGVQFSIRGSVSGCVLRFYARTKVQPLTKLLARGNSDWQRPWRRLAGFRLGLKQGARSGTLHPNL